MLIVSNRPTLFARVILADDGLDSRATCPTTTTTTTMSSVRPQTSPGLCPIGARRVLCVYAHAFCVQRTKTRCANFSKTHRHEGAVVVHSFLDVFSQICWSGLRQRVARQKARKADAYTHTHYTLLFGRQKFVCFDTYGCSGGVSQSN